MSRTRILEGVDGKAILHAKGMAFGPVFFSKADAESFLHFISHTKAECLEWEGGGFPMGAHLYMMWDRAGKKPERECVQFTIKDLTKPEPEPDEKPGSWERKWSFFCDMEWYCFPLFLSLNGCGKVGDIFKRDGVIRSNMTDHGGDCLRVWFNTEKAAQAFIKRLNRWLKDNWHKAYPKEGSTP